MRELIENSIISSYLKIAGAIAEGSSSRAKMGRAFRSIMRKADRAVASAKTPEEAAKVKDKAAAKLAPVAMRGEYKERDSEGRARGKLRAAQRAEDEGQDVEKVIAEIPSGKTDSTQRAGRQLKMTRKGQAGARTSGRVINRAQQYPTNVQRDASMHNQREAEKKRRARAAAERSERIKRRASLN